MAPWAKKNQPGTADVLIYLPGEKIMVPVVAELFNVARAETTDIHVFQPIHDGFLGGNLTYEKLTTLDGEPVPDKAAEGLAIASHLTNNFIERDQHLGREPPGSSTVFTASYGFNSFTTRDDRDE